MMSQEKGFGQWISNQFYNFDEMIHNRADLFRWSETRLNVNKHKKQSQRIWETLVNTVICSSKTESKVAKKFKRISSIPIQIWLSKNDKI